MNGRRLIWRIAVATIIFTLLLSAVPNQTDPINLQQQARNVELVGQINTPGSAWDVVVAGDYAYVADWRGGLRIIDISDPAHPTETGFIDTPGYAQSVYVSGSYAYVADDYVGGLRIIDISDPTNPQEVGYYDTLQSAIDVHVSGTYAYLIDGALFRILDVSNPANPQAIGYYAINEPSHAVFVSGSYAYVASELISPSGGRLHVLNVSNPWYPTEVGYHDMPPRAYGVTVVGDYAHVADMESGLYIINVSNPANPQEVGYYDTPGQAWDVAAAGNYAYVADENSGLRVIGIADPIHPTEIGYYDTIGNAQGVTVVGDYIYVADGSDGLLILRYTGRTITGNVADGHGHSLPGVFVGLLRDADVSYAMTTTTDDNGFYVFNNIPSADTYKVRVILRDGSGKTRIHWGQYGLLVNVTTQPFSFAAGQTSKTVHVHFTNASLESGLIPTDVLDDLAVMFYHAQQVNNFVRSTLGESDFQPVEGIWAFSPFGERAHYCPTVDPDCPDARWVHISTSISRWDHPNRPMNREWHESFHHLMNDTIGMPLYAGGPYNHRGYENPTTGDSWAEGWAEFWPCVLWGTLPDHLDPHLYRWSGARPVNFEENWKVWDYQGSHSREEFAVASLLWDLYDPINPADDDFIDLTISQIWDVIGKQTLENMGDVYDALVAKRIGEGNSDGDALSDLEELFVAHGFFVDTYGGVSNQRYDPGEEVGRAAYVGKADRRNTPYPENAYLLVNVVDKDGNPVSDCTLTVSIEYEPPNDYLDYDFEVELKQATRNMVGLAPSPTSRPETMRITAKCPGGSISQEYSITNAEYWQKVEDSTTGYAEEITFVVEYKIYLPLILKGR